MAVYMSAARQRRRTIAIAAAALLLGIIGGVLIGRSTASGVDDALGASRSRGRSLAAALRALPVEYEQAYSESGESQAGIEDAINRVADQADTAIAKAPWLSSNARTRLTTRIGTVVEAARRGESPSDFEAIVEEAAITVEDDFGLT